MAQINHEFHSDHTFGGGSRAKEFAPRATMSRAAFKNAKKKKNLLLSRELTTECAVSACTPFLFVFFVVSRNAGRRAPASVLFGQARCYFLCD